MSDELRAKLEALVDVWREKANVAGICASSTADDGLRLMGEELRACASELERILKEEKP